MQSLRSCWVPKLFGMLAIAAPVALNPPNRRIGVTATQPSWKQENNNTLKDASLAVIRKCMADLSHAGCAFAIDTDDHDTEAACFAPRA